MNQTAEETLKVAGRPDVATLIVGNHMISDWTSVWVQHRWTESESLFKFTAVERDAPLAVWWEKLQIKPPDECAIYLGDQLAIVGVVLQRQVAYDANQHGIQIIGKGVTWYTARGSITKKRNFDGKTFTEVASEVLKEFKQSFEVVGKINDKPFPRLQVEPGITVWAFLEKLARNREVILGSDHRGNILLIGKHTEQASTALIEGNNILKAQIVLNMEQFYSDYIMNGSTAATDGHAYATASEQMRSIAGRAKKYSPLLQVMEHPVWTADELMQRALFEKQIAEGTIVTADITVNGWHMPSGKLWQVGGSYLVKSPMGILDQELKAEKVTFTQDNNTGTLTTLELVSPWKLNAKADYNLGNDKVVMSEGEEGGSAAP